MQWQLAMLLGSDTNTACAMHGPHAAVANAKLQVSAAAGGVPANVPGPGRAQEAAHHGAGLRPRAL